MATWASELDVLADLDMLSEFSAGPPSAQNVEIPPLQLYGRGFMRSEKPETEELAVEGEEEFPFQPVFPNIPSGCGRGERILALTRHRHDRALQRQLRMTMGPGYSNELIEDFIRREISKEESGEVGQFDDPASLSEESTSTAEEQKVSQQEQELETTLKQSNSPKPEQEHNKTSKEHTKVGIKMGQCRNIVLKNLTSYNSDPNCIPHLNDCSLQLNSKCSQDEIVSACCSSSTKSNPTPEQEVNTLDSEYHHKNAQRKPGHCRNSLLNNLLSCQQSSKSVSKEPVIYYKRKQGDAESEVHKILGGNNIPFTIKKNLFLYKEDDFPPL